jgi:DNA-binding transcriptional MerR regulator
MLRMPVGTLRIWERRYGVAAPPTTPSGHRQYSAADVQRLALVRQLTMVGHPIGSVATLETERLREVASTHASALTGVQEPVRSGRKAWKVAVVGAGAEHRLLRADVQMRLGCVLKLASAFDRLEAVRRGGSRSTHDALVVFVDGLQVARLRQIQAARNALHARRVAVVYSYATISMKRAFSAAGIALLREPADDEQLAEWLATLAGPSDEPAKAGRVAGAPLDTLSVAATAPTERRYDDATLADFAGLSSTIACECPRHVAEIIMKLSHFESYSAQCEHLNAADGALHADLSKVSATARSMFEAALERLAIHEGLLLQQA